LRLLAHYGKWFQRPIFEDKCIQRVREKWVHRNCSGMKGSVYKVMKTFICRSCVNLVIGTRCTSVDTVVNANLELVDKFCYLGDMLTVDGDADAAVENRI